MKKRIAVSAATGLAVATVGLASFAVMSPSAVGSSQVLADCHVHVNDGGNDVDVNWC
ncbi:hypothetical protein [Mycobacterium sp.]|jgi:hypothetical protein|uniref:hypothetical protein n=1 Tax=Mycobacterium sp. TaxID=1785 RepID=UPI002D6DC77E|nr:hypothetical protein [Mycobacterium sp.]HZA10045.1 hypothetical protein [Mycobacterium sp.]